MVTQPRPQASKGRTRRSWHLCFRFRFGVCPPLRGARSTSGCHPHPPVCKWEFLHGPEASDHHFLCVETAVFEMSCHLRFIARTVMVPNDNVDAAYRVLHRILTMDGVIDEAKRRRYYEKPCRRRYREAYETCRRIYNEEMNRKINFLIRKKRPDPWLGC